MPFGSPVQNGPLKDLPNPKVGFNGGTVDSWYRYYAGYSADFVTHVLTALVPVASTVLDPWNGTGTTTVVAASNQRNSYGFDINPALNVVSRSSASLAGDRRRTSCTRARIRTGRVAGCSCSRTTGSRCRGPRCSSPAGYSFGRQVRVSCCRPRRRRDTAPAFASGRSAVDLGNVTAWATNGLVPRWSGHTRTQSRGLWGRLGARRRRQTELGDLGGRRQSRWDKRSGKCWLSGSALRSSQARSSLSS